MKPNSQFSEYKRIMSCIDIDDSSKQQIIKSCARRSTLNKIKAGKYRIIAVIKNSEIQKF